MPAVSARAAETLIVLERQRELLRQTLDAARGDTQRGRRLAGAAALGEESATVPGELD